MGDDSVRGVNDSPPYTHDLDFVPNARTAIATQAGMDSSDGGWAILYGDNPVSEDAIDLAIDEDQLDGGGRSSVTEQVAYIVFESTRNTTDVTDQNLPPVAVAGGRYRAEEEETIQFDGRESFDPDGEIVAYIWDFGDGGTAEGPNPRYTFEDEGRYDVTLTVIDDDGASDSDEGTAIIDDD